MDRIYRIEWQGEARYAVERDGILSLVQGDIFATLAAYLGTDLPPDVAPDGESFLNVLRGQGLPRDEAILEANHTRLRPILMTTVMLIAAMIPIALGQGPGAASRASLAKVILGGQTLSLLLTLLVTPVAYSLWDDVSRVWWRFVGWVASAQCKAVLMLSVPQLVNTTALGSASIRVATFSLAAEICGPS